MSNLLSVVILTFNEEKNLPKCLESLKKLDSEIFIVDSFSTDSTEQIAKDFGANVYRNRFETHVKQWKYALENLPLQSEWILGLDADQELTRELADELNQQLHLSSPEINGYYINRRNIFLDQWIRHGGYYPFYLLKLFRRKSVYLDESELMDHHFYVHGKTGKLKYDLVENNLKEDLSFWIRKHVRYAELQSYEEHRQLNIQRGSLWGNQDQRRLYLKNTWNRMPLFFRSLLYFKYRYFLRMGFLDGKKGFMFHFLQAFWYRFTVDAMIWQAKKKETHAER